MLKTREKQRAVLKVVALTLLWAAGFLVTSPADQAHRVALSILVGMGVLSILAILVCWREKPVTQQVFPPLGEAWRGTWRKYQIISGLVGVEILLQVIMGALATTTLLVQQSMVVVSIAAGVLAIVLWILWYPQR